MKTATYSFGEDSPIKFQLNDKVVEHYNSAVEKFFAAQRRFLQKVGRAWDPATDPIAIDWNRKEKKAWAEVAVVFNKQLTATGPWHANDIMDDYLVKNGPEVAQTAAIFAGSAIGGAVMFGVVWELLRPR